MRAFKWVVVTFFLMGMLGCSQVQEYLEIARDDAVSREYFDTLNRYTRAKTLYSEFETRIRVVATWKNQKFTDAYLAEYARLYLLTGSDRKEREGILSAVSSGFREFLLYAYTPDRESNDLAEADSIWKVFLLAEGGEQTEPIELREIESGPLVTKFFPYVKPYGKCYSIKFPVESRSDRSGPTLVFTGVLGKVVLEWRDNKDR